MSIRFPVPRNPVAGSRPGGGHRRAPARRPGAAAAGVPVRGTDPPRYDFAETPGSGM
ncbi:hypothetical protein Ate01nite_47930 [Actinoplanes teichomyceticus]|nr:hypothetical protein Ate01nite_47930 [Actinoplanes teichomyceticus]